VREGHVSPDISQIRACITGQLLSSKKDVEYIHAQVTQPEEEEKRPDIPEIPLELVVQGPYGKGKDKDGGQLEHAHSVGWTAQSGGPSTGGSAAVSAMNSPSKNPRE